MSGSSGDAAGDARRGVPDGARSHRVAYLDRALWSGLAAAGSREDIARYWLELQCLMIDGVVRGAVFLQQGEALLATACWPDRAADGPTSLLTTARRALKEGRGVVSGHREEERPRDALCCCAFPFVVDGRPHGAVAVEIDDRSQDELRRVIRALQWGSGWIEVATRRGAEQASRHTVDKITTALDVLAAVVEQSSYKAAARTLATELAMHLQCELVATGMRRRGHMQVESLSHSAEFGQRMSLVRTIAAAMDEAADQAAAVVFPVPEEGEFRVTLAHEALASVMDDGSVLSLPLLTDDKVIGALLLVRGGGDPFDQDAVDLCDAVAAACGPVLEEKRRNDRHLVLKIADASGRQLRRLFGPHYLGRKIAAVCLLALLGVLTLVDGSYRVSAPARIEGNVQRAVVAPFDGYILSQAARAGDRVKAGSLLARIDDRDMRLEHVRWTTTRQQRLAEYDQAVGQHDRAATNIARAQVQQAEAHIALLDEQLARTELRAAFDAIVVSGDLSQAVGAAVSRGEQLFELAPLDSYRVILEVDETQVLDIAPGQQGNLKVGSLLDRTLPYRIEQITPITEARDGRNYFRVEAGLLDIDPRLRPGMEGVAKTDAGERRYLRIWAGELIDWFRLKLWAWWP